MNESQHLRKLAFHSPKYYLILPVVLAIVPIFYISSRNEIFTLIYSVSLAVLLVTDVYIPKLFKFKFPMQRVLFLDLIALYAALAFYLIVIGFRFLNPALALMLSVSTIPFTRTLVFITFTERRVALTHFLGISFSLFFSLFVFLLDRKYAIFIAPLVLSSIVYSLSSHLFVKFSLSRFIKEFSTDPIKFLAEVVNTVASDFSYNSVIRKFFEDMYSTLAPREVSVVRMRAENTDFMMVFPYVHPGPLGEIGSSNITGKLQSRNPGKKLLVFHTTTTHDDNCAGDAEIDKISAVLNGAGKEFTYCYDPYLGEHFTFLPIGDGGIFFLSPDNPRFDDVKIAEGRKIVRKAKSCGLKWAVAVDQHNNIMDEPKELEDASYLMGEVENAVKSRKLKKVFSMGYGQVNPGVADIGPGGISFLSFKAADKKIAIVLVDGNNMELGLRTKIHSSLNGYERILVCTTDNHVVNTRGLMINPVGRYTSHDAIVGAVKEAERMASDVKECKAEYFKKDIWLKVAGENQYDRLNKMIRSSANKAKISSAVAIISSIALSLIIFKILN